METSMDSKQAALDQSDTTVMAEDPHTKTPSGALERDTAQRSSTTSRLSPIQGLAGHAPKPSSIISSRNYSQALQKQPINLTIPQTKKVLVLKTATVKRANAYTASKTNPASIVMNSPDLVPVILSQADEADRLTATQINQTFLFEATRLIWRGPSVHDKLCCIKNKNRRGFYAKLVRKLVLWPTQRLWVNEPGFSRFAAQVPLRRLESFDFYTTCIPPSNKKGCMSSFLGPALRTLTIQDGRLLPSTTANFEDQPWFNVIAASCPMLTSLTIIAGLRIQSNSLCKAFKACKCLRAVSLGPKATALLDDRVFVALAALPTLESLDCYAAITQRTWDRITDQIRPGNIFRCLRDLRVAFDEVAGHVAVQLLEHCRKLRSIHVEFQNSHGRTDVGLDADFFGCLAQMPTLEKLDISLADGMELFAADLLLLGPASQLRHLGLLSSAFFRTIDRPRLWVTGEQLAKLLLAFPDLENLDLRLETEAVYIKYDDYIIVDALSSKLNCFNHQSLLSYIDEPEYFDDWPTSY